MAEKAQHVTLAANTVLTVTLTGDYQSVDVVNVSGTAAVYCTSDGTAPAIKGDETSVVPASIGAFTTLEAPGNTTVVKIISAGIPDVAVEGRLR